MYYIFGLGSYGFKKLHNSVYSQLSHSDHFKNNRFVSHKYCFLRYFLRDRDYF